MPARFPSAIRRPRCPNGRHVSPSIDRVAATTWVCAIASRCTAVALVLFWSVSGGLVALAADLMLSMAVNARLRRVINRRGATGELDLTAPTMTQTWWSRRSAKAAIKYDAKADKCLARAAATKDELKAWTLRRKADRKRLWAAAARSYVVTTRSGADSGG